MITDKDRSLEITSSVSGELMQLADVTTGRLVETECSAAII
jgi:hypothetical protein